jgi:hypothetical protein
VAAVVRVEFVREGNVIVAAEKNVTTASAAPCVVAFEPERVAGTDCALIATIPNPVGPSSPGFRYTVRLVSGVCDRVTGTLAGSDGTVLQEVDAAISADAPFQGTLTFAPETTTLEVSLTAAFSVIHPTNTDLNGRVEQALRVDNIAPELTFVAPDGNSQGVIAVEDDADANIPGIQYAARVATTATDVRTATLLVDDAEVGAVSDVSGGDITFPVTTFAEDARVTLAASAVDACNNIGRAELVTDVLVTPGAVAIVAPASGTTLLAVEDGDRDTTEVFETTVTVAVARASDGATITVSCGEAEVGSLEVDQASVDGRYQVAVALPASTVGAELVCTAVVGDGAPSQAVTWIVAIPAPVLTLVSPLGQSGSALCFNSNEVPVTFAASGLDGRDISWGAGSDVSGTLGPVADGAFDGVLALPADSADGEIALSFAATDTFGNATEALQGPVLTVIRLDRQAPALAFDVPATAVVDGDATADADPTTPGWQGTIGGTVTDTDPTGQVCVAGGACTDVAADGTWSLVVTLARGTNTITVQATDDCNNTSPPVTRVITLERDLEIRITAPTTGATLLASDDTNPATATTFETAFSVTTTAATAGDTITVACRTDAEGSSPLTVGTTTVPTPSPVDGQLSVTVALPVATLGNNILCRASQSGSEVLSSEEIALVVGLPAPALAITNPADGACITSNTLAVAGTAANLNGRNVALTLGGLSASAAVATNVWSTNLDISSLAEGGPVALSASATDAFGNPVAAGASLRIDRVIPQLAFQAPSASIDPTSATDTSPQPGYQTNVIVAVDDGGVSGTNVCLSLDGSTPACRAASGPTVTFSNVTLQPGPNELLVTATDACGNAAEPTTLVVTLLTDPPVVRIVVPATDIVTTASSISITAAALEPGTNLPITTADVRLLVDGVQSAVVGTNNGDGTWTFASVPLVSGSTSAMVVEVTRDFATGASAPRSIRQKNVQPTIAVTSPVTGFLNLTSAFCTNVGSSCTGTVVATTTDTEDSSTALLSIDCGSGASSVPGTVNTNSVSFPNVTLAEAATCTLSVAVTDAAGQNAESSDVIVTVDRIAPIVGFVGLPSIIQPVADVDAATPGIQTALRVSAVGADVGSTLTVTFAWVENNAPQTKTVTAVIADGVTEYNLEEAAGSGAVTWPEGVVTLTASAFDAAANEGTATAPVTVNSTASVAISAPASVADTCSTSCTVGVCHEGACWRGWGTASSRTLTVNLAGLATTTNNVRVCSDSAALAISGAPLCASASGPSGPYRQVLLTNGINGSNALNLTSVLPVGYQRLIVEALPLSSGGWITTLNATSATARLRRIFLDLTAPVVSGVTSPSDTLEPPGYLNSAEQVSAPRVYSVGFTASEAGRAEIVVNGIIVRTENVAAGDSVFDVTLPEGQPNVWVVLTDAVGNASPGTLGQGAVVYQPIVDVTAPTLAFTRPSSSPLNATSNRDVSLTSNAEGRTVTVFDDGVQVGAGVVNAGVVTIPNSVVDILDEGEHRLTARVTDVAGNERTATTTPALVLVDTLPPAVAIVAPANNADFDDADDAAPVTPGFQVDVRFSTNDGATTWTVLTAANCDDTFTTCDSPTQRATGPVTNAGGNEPDVRIDAPISAQVSRFRVIVRGADVAGNIAETAHNVTVTSNICQVVFTDLPTSDYFNATYCANGTNCASADLSLGAGTIGFCVASTIELLVDGVVLASSPLASFDGTFEVSVADAQTLDLEVRLTLAGVTVTSSSVETRTTDFTPPGVDFVAIDVDGFMTPAEGASGVFVAADDLEPGTPGMQFHAALELDDVNASGGSITALGASDGISSVALLPFNFGVPGQVFGVAPITTELRELTLDDGATWTVTATATDAAGNPSTSTFTAQVDVLRPAPVQIAALTFDKRRPRLAPLEWVAVGDNGMNGGPVAAYEVRYSTLPITDANWDGACDFQDAYGSENMPTAAAAGDTMTANLGGPDSRVDTDPCKLAVRFETADPADDPALYVAIRAIDAAGNLSTIAPDSTEMLTNGDVWLETRRIRFDNSTGTLGFTPTSLAVSGASIRDINGDDINDFGLGVTLANAACIILGHDVSVAGETISVPSGTHHDCLTPAAAATVIADIDRVGDQVLSLGDVNGDGLFDFGITVRRLVTAGPPAVREAMLWIYLGADSNVPQSLVAPDVILRGIVPQSATIGYVSACGVGDANGTGPEDIGIGEPSLSRFHVLPGQATWAKAGAGGPSIIDLGAPGAILDNDGMTFTMTVTTGTPLFGGRCARAGDVLPTPVGEGGPGIGDILVAQTGFDNGRIFLLPGRAWTAGATQVLTQYLTTPTAEDLRSLRLRQELTGQETNSVFAVDFQGGVDATGDGVPDVLAGASNRTLSAGRDGKSIYLFDGAALADLVGTDVRVDIGANPLVGGSWRGANGWVFRSDFPGRFGSARLLPGFTGVSFGDPAFTPPHLMHANTNSRTLLFRANHQNADEDYELGLFPVGDGTAVNRFTAGDISIGGWLTGGFDFTGDGAVDIVTGTNFSEVLIIR